MPFELSSYRVGLPAARGDGCNGVPRSIHLYDLLLLSTAKFEQGITLHRYQVEAAAWEFEGIEAMIRTAEGLFGPYDWDRYDMIVLPPSFPYGGMANPRVTFFPPPLLAGDRSLVDVLAHELPPPWALAPEMVLLGEPMAGMGHEDIERISALIKAVSADRTVLMVEHNLSVVANLSHRITVLTRGRVLAEGDYETVSADPQVREAYMGVGHA